ncbi:hypothetical protein AB9P05_21850 [Roseivirga sp. BDSF3-8]|uniref:DUF6933 domain-containing protein n=1 Tax=Roseivirga sp. BDSF3-8 TaxID=3241598 RepID=UPI0035319C93
MNIYCTNKLEKLIGKKLMAEEPEPEGLLGNWNANLFPLKGRKCIILVNDVTYYPIILLDVLKKDLLNFHELFYERLIMQLSFDGIAVSEECKLKLKSASEPHFLKTNNNRKVLGTITNFIYELEAHFYRRYGGIMDPVLVPELNNRLTRTLVGAIKPKQFDYGVPKEEMEVLLQNICD